MLVFLGILLLVFGAAYPMAALFWFNRRMAERPPLTPRRVGMILAFNGVLPVAVILAGICCLVPRLWQRLEIKAGIGVSLLAALVLAVLLLATPQPVENTSETEPAQAGGRGSDGR